MNPTMTKSMTAPIVALTIDPMKPANGRNPNCVSSQTPMKAPTIPMTMFQRRPEAKTAYDLPGQPAGNRADDQHDDNAVYSNHDVLPSRPGTSVPPPFCDAT
jgi:hypothetical protein